MEERMEEIFAVMDPADEIMMYGNRFFNKPKTMVQSGGRATYL